MPLLSRRCWLVNFQMPFGAFLDWAAFSAPVIPQIALYSPCHCAMVHHLERKRIVYNNYSIVHPCRTCGKESDDAFLHAHCVVEKMINHWYLIVAADLLLSLQWRGAGRPGCEGGRWRSSDRVCCGCTSLWFARHQGQCDVLHHSGQGFGERGNDWGVWWWCSWTSVPRFVSSYISQL